MAIVCQTESIRDVIAFPKSHEGRDLMSGAPTYVSQDELDIYHIFVKKWERGTRPMLTIVERKFLIIITNLHSDMLWTVG